MRYHFIALIIGILSSASAIGQNYTSYFTGNTSDTLTAPSGGVCMMGGATEDDNAMIWFLQRANRGDILVLRASGSDGYNDYLYSDLGVSVNSVETIVFNHSSAANEVYVHQKIQQAEAIWFAGGDQWDYVSYWRNSPVDSLINDGIAHRNIVIGGTSAGMAILGGFYFSAENGTVTSATALSNPYNNNVTVDSSSFLKNQYLSDVITDTHYDDPDRKGRHVVFLSRILVDYGIEAKGIACDEYTAVCVDTSGIARVFGNHPTYDDNAYFIQTNCELTEVTPENCTANNPLNWNLGNEAIKVYVVKGTAGGTNAFDLNNWSGGAGGVWQNWFVDNGVLNQQSSDPLDCSTISSTADFQNQYLSVYPNPSSDYVMIKLHANYSLPVSLVLKNAVGQVVKTVSLINADQVMINTGDLSRGIYFIELKSKNNRSVQQKLIIR